MAHEPTQPMLDAIQLRQVAEIIDTLNALDNSLVGYGNEESCPRLPAVIPIKANDGETVFGYADCRLVEDYLFVTDPDEV